MRKRILSRDISIMILLFIIFLSGCTKGKKTETSHADEDGHTTEVHEDRVVKLDKESQEMIQLETGIAEKMSVEKRIRVYGEIAQDTENYAYVTANTHGQVEKLSAKLGDIIEKGDTALTIRKDDGEIKEILSPAHGTVLAIHVKPQDKVDNVRSLISIVNLDRLRVSLDIYEKDLRFVRIGQRVEIETIAYPGKKFLGEVVYISPQVDEETQTIKVRADVDNSEHLLRLGMFVTGELVYRTDEEVISVRLSAVQHLDGEDIVFVPDREGFSAKEVLLGREFGDYVEIKDGLVDGDKLVTRGSFMLKSEMLKETFGGGHGH